MKLKKVISLIEKEFPREFSDKSDNTGLQIGDYESSIDKILVALELTEAHLNEAIDIGASLIITHHPLFFKDINNIIINNSRGALITKLIKNNISVYSMHTNVDAIKGGINDYMAELLDLMPLKPFEPVDRVKLQKLVTFIPLDSVDKVRNVLLDGETGRIGNYSHCSFNIDGVGTYLPLKGTKPYIGKEGVLEKTNEVRFETILYSKDVSRVIELLKSVHPYEEVAYDIYPLDNNEGKPGFGRYCKSKAKTTLRDILELIPKKFDIEYVRFNGALNKELKNIALINGSGGNFIHKITEVDLFITGDLSYHQAMYAIEKDMAFIDLGHEQEKIFIPYLLNKLKLEGVEIIGSNNKVFPFKIKLYKEI